MARGRRSGKATSKQAGAPAAGSSSGVFLGTLRSEFDEPAALPAVFTGLLAEVEATLAAYAAGTLDEHETAAQLQTLTLTDVHGAQWAVGATTRRWYRRPPGGSWLPTPPPAASADAVSHTVTVDEALLTSMTREASRVSSLDAPSHLYAGTKARPVPGSTSSAPVPPVLELDLATVSDRPVRQPAAKAERAADVPVWDASPDLPADAVALPEGVSATLALDLPAEPSAPAPSAPPAAEPRPARSGLSLEQMLSGFDAPAAGRGYGEYPVAPGEPGPAAGGDDVAAMLAELMATRPVAGDDVEVEEIHVDLPPLS